MDQRKEKWIIKPLKNCNLVALVILIQFGDWPFEIKHVRKHINIIFLSGGRKREAKYNQVSGKPD